METAIILPLLLLLTFGIWVTARAWNVHNVLDHAARESARIGATTGDVSRMTTVARGEVQASSVPWTSITECFSVIDGGPGGGAVRGGGSPCIAFGGASDQDPTTDDRVQVTLTYPNYQLEFLFFTISVDLETKAIARLEPGV
ncbi:MAG TPA: TadE/TadG family type IV pilus assembly protein [Acidimicrobiia bacterium]|nr:TadE/TadG family type IV pilus assembly protein [Acidimicrobiia bacterium]